LKTTNKKKESAIFCRVKINKQVISEQYQTQAQEGINIVIRRRRGEQDKRIHFSKQGK
jgi:hypothetical protein